MELKMGCAPSKSHARKSSGMSTKRMTSRQTGNMSTAHGTNTGNKSKGLYSSGGSGRVGQDCRTFNSGIRKPGGPRELS